jgi:hypothetical protein
VCEKVYLQLSLDDALILQDLNLDILLEGTIFGDCYSETVTNTTNVIILDQTVPLNANFTYTNPSCNPLVQFTSQSATGLTHSWQFFNSSGTLLGNSTLVNPSFNFGSTGNYSATHTVSNACGSVTVTLPVVPVCNFTCGCTGSNAINIGAPGQTTNFSGAGIANNLSNKCIAIAGTFIVNQGTLTIDASEMRMQPGSEIIVSSGATLTINNCNAANGKIHGCNIMWSGITVEGGGTLNFKGNQIEDAKFAINLAGGSKLACSGNTFDKDFVGIYVDAGGGTVQLASTISGNTFTCSGNLLPSFDNSAPSVGTRTHVGIFLRNTIGFDLNVVNFFSQLYNGIFVENSKFSIKNQVISDMSGYADIPFPWGVNGVGILYRDCDFGSNFVESNIISGVAKGIESARSSNDILRNIITAVPANPSLNASSGIRVGDSNNKRIVIEDNIASAVSPVSVGRAFNASKLQVQYNTLKPVNIGLTMSNCSVSTEGDGIVYDNKIDLIQLSHGMRINSCNTLKVKLNKIRPDINLTGLGYNSGITLSNSSHLQVRDNSITGGPIQPPNASTTHSGINVVNTSDVVYCCNTVDNTDYGLRFFMACNPAVVGTTQFNNHVNALLYSQSGITGLQNGTGNTWNFNSPGFDAWHKGGFNEANLSRYRVPSNQRPFDANPPLPPQSTNWFTFDGGPGACGSDCGVAEWPVAGIDDLDLKVANGELALLENGTVIQWIEENNLYKKLMKNPNLGNGITAIQVFKQAKQNQEIGLLYNVWANIEQAWQYPISIGTDMATKRQSLDNMMAQLEVLDAALAQATEQEKPTLLSQRLTLTNNMSSVAAQYGQLQQTFQTGLMTSLSQIATTNNSILCSSIPAYNNREVNKLQLAFWLQGYSLTNAQLIELYVIAAKCPLEDGDAVLYARGFFESIVGRTINWESYEQCGLPLGQRAEKEDVEPAVQDAGEIKLYPNPASNNITVSLELPDGVDYSLSLLDMNGRLAGRFNLSAGQNNLSLDGIPTGVYVGEVTTNRAVLYRTKLIVSR